MGVWKVQDWTSWKIAKFLSFHIANVDTKRTFIKASHCAPFLKQRSSRSTYLEFLLPGFKLKLRSDQEHSPKRNSSPNSIQKEVLNHGWIHLSSNWCTSVYTNLPRGLDFAASVYLPLRKYLTKQYKVDFSRLKRAPEAVWYQLRHSWNGLKTFSSSSKHTPKTSCSKWQCFHPLEHHKCLHRLGHFKWAKREIERQLQTVKEQRGSPGRLLTTSAFICE